MGFQVGDLRGFCAELGQLHGVSGVWLLGGSSDRDGIIYVTVQGFDAEAHGHRIDVIRAVERYRASYQEAMWDSQFIFDYAVLVDEEDLGEPHIPAGAERIAA